MIDRVLLGIVALLTVAAVGGVILLWPDGVAAPVDQEPLVDGVVRSAVDVPCPQDPFFVVRPPCLQVQIEVLQGEGAGTTFQVDTGEQGFPPFSVGDRVKVGRADSPEGAETLFYVQDFARLVPLGWLFALFTVVVLGVSRWHGLRSLAGLALSLLVVVRFVVPAILDGRNPMAVALVGGFVVVLVALYVTHGLDLGTTTALVGIAAALAVTAILGFGFTAAAELTGLANEEAQLVQFSAQDVSLRGLVLAGLVIGALGVLDDVAVSQASTVFAIHEANPRQNWSTLYRRAMKVGRDHIASTVNTLVLAYAGASIPLLILFSTGGVPLSDIINSELVAQEIVKTLVGSIGLVSAVPLTTALAVTVVTKRTPAGHSDTRTHVEPEAGHAVRPSHDDWLRSLKDDDH